MIDNVWNNGHKAVVMVAVIFMITTFGNPEVFDRLYLLVLLISFTLLRNTQSTGLLTILLLERLLDEFIYFFCNLDFATIPMYFSAIYVLYICWYDKTTKRILLPIILCSLASEIYWLMTDYDSPQIAYYVTLIAINAYIRNMVWQRFMHYDTGSNLIDFHYFKLLVWYMGSISLMVLEYIVRHVFGLPTLLVYYAYESIQHSIALVALYIILNELNKLHDQSTIRA